MRPLRRLAVFCGSSRGARPAYAEAARRFGTVLGESGLGLVYGGGNIGLMGVVADAALAAGAEVIGVIPDAFIARELAHRGVSELRVVGSMHERKALIADLADAYVALPGGLGTLDELFEAWSWAQLGLHAKPLGLLDVDGFFQPLIAFLDRAAAEGFVRQESRGMAIVEADPERLLDRIAGWEGRAIGEWTCRDQA